MDLEFVMSIRKAFEEELAELKTMLSAMCRLTETMIENAILALTTFDRELGKRVGEQDKRVDEYEMEIEKRCMRLLIKQQPVAHDFRTVSTALKMITDIERFGDQASDIGDLVYTVRGEAYTADPSHLIAMGAIAAKMVRDSVDSFITESEALANEVIRSDDELDAMFTAEQNELISLLRKDKIDPDHAITFMMIAKYLERIGDHAVNVAEWTKYNLTGVHEKF